MRLKLLTVGNYKTAKGEARGYLTGILHLAPFNLSGFNVCPMAEIAGCVKACLNTAGRGGIAKGGLVTHDSVKDGTRTNKVQEARIRRTRLFLENRAEFMSQLHGDIVRLRDQARKMGLKLAIRLNGTSDIRWEDIPYNAFPFRYPNIFARFPDVRFYDYTKIPNRLRALDIPNYSLTFSYSGIKEFAPYVQRAIENYGGKVNVAVVFGKFPSSLYYRDALPSFLRDRKIIDGDENDLRFLDPPGCVIALKAKGQAKKDTTGFVVR